MQPLNEQIMSKKNVIFTILLLTYLNSFSQNIPNDTIVKKDGTKIIENFKTITVHKDYLITSAYEISIERIESINEEDLKKIAIPLKEIDKVISNGIYQKKRKFLNENDVIWESKKNNDKKKVWVHSRSQRKTVILPDGKLKLLPLLVEGVCNLTIDLKFGNYSNPDTPRYYYYVQRKGEQKSTLFKGEPREFIKTKKIEYFDDCMKAKEFMNPHKKISRLQIIKLVKLYNEYCDDQKLD
ncbi:hypothetical protein [Winogradskyella sp. PG-2]|uniref:hypothetical protein n=1 Tax=Winogradskyella sp. PG-2 TaxID=754409 RepID=UPI0004587D2C|nr:hypothetical protein [Winogradskyella sp. PG-2]BAO77499.1 hypothetical protein WPG_3269 [Winogradskyella sp. PG-2]